MSIARVSSLVPVLLAGALACGGHRGPRLAPVSVEGTAADVRALAGEWQGQFVNTVARRSGRIVFSLEPDRALGKGSVILPAAADVPVCPDPSRPQVQPGAPQVELRIGRLVVDDGSIAGWLESYHDAERGCMLDTWFVGQRVNDTIRGDFFAHPSAGDTIQMGRWWAARVR